MAKPSISLATRVPQSMSTLFRRMWRHMSALRRRQYVLLFCLMVLSSFAELVSIGSVLPFLTALTRPQAIFANADARRALDTLGIESNDGLIITLTGAFVAATVLSCVVRVGLLWSSTRTSFAFGSDLSNEAYRSTLQQPYEIHVSRNSSEVVNAIWGKISEITFYMLLPAMTLVTSSIVAAAICIALVWAVPGTALVALGILVLVYGVIVKFSKQRLRVNSERIAQGSTDVIKTLQEGLGGIRDILIDGSQDYFAEAYREVNAKLRRAQGDNQIIGLGPRYLLEAMGMLLIAALAYMLTMRASGIATAIPLLAGIALGLQRLLPAAQAIFNAWSTMHGAQASLQDVLDMLDLQSTANSMAVQGRSSLDFQRDIRLVDMSFRYKADGPWLFDELSLTIAKGSRVGFVGVTGSGKSTLLDIVMGLLEPAAGRIEIDGVPIDEANRGAWQRHIAHVPQSVFLADRTLEENIAFGIPKIDIDPARIRRAARQAQLGDLVEAWPAAYATRVGERGVQLSGGQRQRIGIARALYKNASVIVFDEATSALDNDTEQSVMDAIEGLSADITVLIIAHRLNTLKGCGEILEVGNGIVRRRLPHLHLADSSAS